MFAVMFVLMCKLKVYVMIAGVFVLMCKGVCCVCRCVCANV